MNATETVLLLDDYPDSCEAVATWLELEGYTTICATTVDDAVAALARDEVHVVVMEPYLRSGPAMQVAQAARAKGGRRVLVISMSASGREGDHTAYEPTLFDYNFVKPFSLEMLRQALTMAR